MLVTFLITVPATDKKQGEKRKICCSLWLEGIIHHGGGRHSCGDASRLWLQEPEVACSYVGRSRSKEKDFSTLRAFSFPLFCLVWEPSSRDDTSTVSVGLPFSLSLPEKVCTDTANVGIVSSLGLFAKKRSSWQSKLHHHSWLPLSRCFRFCGASALVVFCVSISYNFSPNMFPPLYSTSGLAKPRLL